MLLLGQLSEAASGHAGCRSLVDGLKRDLAAPAEQREMLARRIVQRLILAAQAGLMLDQAPAAVAEAFIASRIDPESGRVYGTLGAASLQQGILDRAWAGY